MIFRNECLFSFHRSWYIEDEEGNRRKLIDTDRLQTSNGVVTIRSVKLGDEGRYVCIARNSAGEERTESVLTVVIPLQTKLYPQEQRVEIGHEAVFNCSIQGESTLELELSLELRSGSRFILFGTRNSRRAGNFLVDYCAAT